MCAEQIQDIASTSEDIKNHPAGWKISAQSVCGSSHEKLNMPCQDAHSWTLRSDQVLVATVADGAGSAKQSDVGAAIAAQKAVEILSTEPALAARLHKNPEAFRPILRNALAVSLQAVKTRAETLSINIRDLASTLIVVIATPQVIATAQIGDGAAVTCDKTGNLTALTTPDSGEYINQTTFLISPGAIDTAQYHIWHGDNTHIALFSDGLQMLALTMPFGKPHAPFFSPLFKFISAMKRKDLTEIQLASFLRSSRVQKRTDDDLTLLLAARTDCAHATHSQI